MKESQMCTKENTRRRKLLRLLFAGGTFLILTLTSCLTVEQMAPPVTTEFSRSGANVVSLAALERGREVYISDCTRCHSVEPINRYSVDRWRSIIDRMGPESKLDESRTDALRNYILAAHKVLERQAVEASHKQ